MDVVLVPVIQVLLAILGIYKIVVFVAVIMSWLLNFNIVNYHNQVVRIIWDICTKLTEPLLGPIRRFMPNLGGLDLSPIILLLGIFFLENILIQLMYKF